MQRSLGSSQDIVDVLVDGSEIDDSYSYRVKVGQAGPTKCDLEMVG